MKDTVKDKSMRLITRAIDELDKTLALIGVLFSLILTIWLKLAIGYPIFIMVGIICFMICTGYLIIRRSIYPSLIPSLEKFRGSTRFYITLNILFFLFFSYSIISVYLRPDTYVRPLGYFISTALMAAILADEILFLSSKKSHICFTLFKIIIIGLSLQYSQILIFPNVVGIDPWVHQWFTLKILNNGHIPEVLSYSKLPLFHLMIVMISLVTDLGYKMATMFSISFLQVVCDALFVFLLGKILINTKVGLLAALLLEIANQHIQFGYWTIPNTMGAIMIIPIVFLLLKVKKDKPFIRTSVTILLMGTMILTHTLTSMCLAIFLLVFWVSFETYTRLYHQKTDSSIAWTTCTLFSTGMLAYWSYISGHIFTLSNLIKFGFRGLPSDEAYLIFSYIPFLEQIFKYLGMIFFFGLSFIGSFYMLSKQFRNSNRFSITIGGIVILCLAFFPLITGNYILGVRWFYFSQIFMAIPLSLSLFLINGKFKSQSIKGFLMFLSVFTLSFLLIISQTANIDNRIFSPTSGIRYAFTESELNGMDTMSRVWNGTIGADWYSHYYLEYQLDSDFICIDDSFYTEDFTDLHDILILAREEISKHPFRTSGSYILLEYDIYLALHDQNISRIYDCGSARGYLQP